MVNIMVFGKHLDGQNSISKISSLGNEEISNNIKKNWESQENKTFCFRHLEFSM